VAISDDGHAFGVTSMNVSQTTGASAAWMLQRLFQSSGDTTTQSTAESAGRQKLPGADDRSCNTAGGGSPAMSGQTMGAMISIQMEAPSASDIASDLISGLDTDGDGEVSADEIATAFSAAGLDTSSIDSALSAIDSDGSGALNADELTTAISSDMRSHGPKGPPPGGGMGGPPPSADEEASSILSALDTDEDSSLGMDEILSAFGMDSDDETGSVSSALASLDSDGDGKLSLAELTSAIQQTRDAGYRAYAQQASLAA